mmetsp:Transcript_13937/g.44797  ORF Transcript_13937/g.44797 Transcript_13937/m.44797 type:complete len:279 (-) Transcript_13937:316-1152(-)
MVKKQTGGARRQRHCPRPAVHQRRHGDDAVAHAVVQRAARAHFADERGRVVDELGEGRLQSVAKKLLDLRVVAAGGTADLAAGLAVEILGTVLAAASSVVREHAPPTALAALSSQRRVEGILDVGPVRHALGRCLARVQLHDDEELAIARVVGMWDLRRVSRSHVEHLDGVLRHCVLFDTVHGEHGLPDDVRALCCVQNEPQLRARHCELQRVADLNRAGAVEIAKLCASGSREQCRRFDKAMLLNGDGHVVAQLLLQNRRRRRSCRLLGQIRTRALC